jgi:hypothetical protein
MSSQVSELLQVLAAMIGLLLLLFSGWSTHGEREHVQSWLEEAWLRFSLLRDSGLSRHIAFTRLIADLGLSGIDRIWGPHLISLRAIPPLVAFTLTSLTGSQFRFSENKSVGQLIEIGLWSSAFLLVMLLPAVWKRMDSYRWPLLIVVVSVFFMLRRHEWFTHWNPFTGSIDWTIKEQFACMIGIIALGGLINLYFIAITRAALRNILKTRLLFIFIAALPGVLYVMGGGGHGEWNMIAMELTPTFLSEWIIRGTLSATYFEVWLLLALGGMVGALLVHVVFWPIVLRSPIYTFVNERIILKRKVVATIGIALVGQQYPAVAGAIQTFLRQVGM